MRAPPPPEASLLELLPFQLLPRFGRSMNKRSRFLIEKSLRVTFSLREVLRRGLPVQGDVCWLEKLQNR